MPYISPQKVAEAKQIDLLTYLKMYEPATIKKIGNDTYCLKEHDSLIISNGKWNWFSQGIGGTTALNFLIKVRGMDFLSAVQTLVGDSNSSQNHTIPASPHMVEQEKQKKAFQLPEKHWNNIKVTAYLQSRGIDNEIINICIRSGLIYESAKFSNCVFVGKNAEGEIKFASLRGILGKRFVQDVEGSEKQFNFSLPPKEIDTKNLLVFESAIDALSHATLYKQSEADLSRDSFHRLSLGGTSPIALNQYLNDHPNINSIGLCLDNDEIGQRAANKIKNLLSENMKDKYSVKILPPPVGSGKDYNDLLLNKKKISHQSNSLQI